MNRRQLRDYTFKLLFHITFYKGKELADQLDNYLEECSYPEEGQLLLVDSEKAELKDRLSLILDKMEEIDGKIRSVAENWTMERMNRVDLSIIRLACYEIFFDKDVPDRVAINEAVELAKKYGGDDSPQFVNGVLARVVRMNNPQTEEF